MSEYVNLLQEARSKVNNLQKPIINSAKEYIPKLCQLFQKEHNNLTSSEVRIQIEKDCKNLWSKRTILDALPDEMKNLTKQSAGRQRHKNKQSYSAAIVAAPKQNNSMVIDNFGRTVLDNVSNKSETSSNNFDLNHLKIKDDDTINNTHHIKENLLNFEFSLQFKRIQQHMSSLYGISGYSGNIWFHGKIDTKSGKVIVANLGKIDRMG